MHIALTNHALMRAKQRGISVELIIKCIQTPDSISIESDGKKCFKKFYNKEYLLLCYCLEEDNKVLVITVIKTSKLEKYFP